MKKIKFLLIAIVILGLSYTACEDMDIADIGIDKIEEAANDNANNTITYPPVFVAVGGNGGGKIYYSYTGTTWIDTGYAGEKMNDVTYDYNNKIFIAVGNSGEIWTSINGVTWADHHPGISNNLYGVTAGDDMVVAVGAYNGTEIKHTILSSSDGENWTDNSIGLPDRNGYDLAGITFQDNWFFTIENYAVSAYPIYSYKVDDIANNWTHESQPLTTAGISIDDLTFINNQLLAIGNSGGSMYGEIYYSVDNGISWSNCQFPDGNLSNVTGLIYNNGRYIAVGKIGINIKIWQTNASTITVFGGSTWIDSGVDVVQAGSFNDIAYGNNTFVAIGMNDSMDNGFIYYSTNNGDSFTAIPNAVSVPLAAIAYKKE
jgi:hypothetical protein